VADDHPAIVESVSHLLEGTSGFEVVARTGDGVEALALIRELRPDLVLIDASLPHLDGVAIARRLERDPWKPRIVLYAGRHDPVQVREALAAGVSAFVLKGGSLAELAQAVEVVAGGGTFVDPALGTFGGDQGPELTLREREVLNLLAEGLGNDEIAVELEISPLTVRTHVKNAMWKLRASTRTEAVATALRRSLI
jgi:DNA-binding NarL/FixJ family response regulator